MLRPVAGLRWRVCRDRRGEWSQWDFAPKLHLPAYLTIRRLRWPPSPSILQSALLTLVCASPHSAAGSNLSCFYTLLFCRFPLPPTPIPALSHACSASPPCHRRRQLLSVPSLHLEESSSTPTWLYKPPQGPPATRIQSYRDFPVPEVLVPAASANSFVPLTC